jgi:hypothetical protein
MTIIEFLEARIAEDEAVAREASARSLEWRSFRGSVHGGTITEPNPEWGDEPDEGYGSITIVYDEGAPRVPEAAHIARHDPARVLAECAAKRLIIRHLIAYQEAILKWQGERPVNNPGADSEWRMMPLRDMVAVYADHPDYPALENVGVLPE